ncbi:MAG: protein kinase [Deltaproteobacteria bacterium]|nr:protein kinase [Deltaproteobacteria bacterium]
MAQQIGRYEVTRELGRGGMGVVYLALDPLIDRQVAIKTALTPPPKDLPRFQQFYKLFFNEVRAAGKLTHPHIVSVYDAAVEDKICYLVLEYIDGLTLKEFCREKSLLSVEKVVKIIFQCAKALDYAHKSGVIHRDIKPGNIMYTKNGTAKISDFGIAAIEGAMDLPHGESLTGSVYYISPEQLENKPLTAQTDIFSLGVVMYELLTGIKPFMGESEVATYYQISHVDPAPLKDHRTDLPTSLEQITRKALEKDRNKRYQSGLELASDLSIYFDHLRYSDEEIKFEEKHNALRRIVFFQDFTPSELSEVLRATQWYEYDTQSTIISEGEMDDSFYIIVAGKVLVTKNERQIAILKRGDCFGEMAYIGKIKRTATIEALENTILMKINATIVDQMSLGTQLRFYKVFSNTLIKRLAFTTEQVSKGS